MQPVRVERMHSDGGVSLTSVVEYPLLRRLFQQRGLEREIADQQDLLQQLSRRGN